MSDTRKSPPPGGGLPGSDDASGALAALADAEIVPLPPETGDPLAAAVGAVGWQGDGAARAAAAVAQASTGAAAAFRGVARAAGGPERRWVMGLLPQVAADGAGWSVLLTGRSGDEPEADAAALAVAVEAGDVGLWRWQADDGRLTVEPRLVAILGLPSGRELGPRDLMNCVAPRDRPRLRRLLVRCLRRFEGAPDRLIHDVKDPATQDGRTVCHAVRSFRDAVTGAPALVGAVVDLTARIEANRRRQASDLRLSLALQAGQIVYWERSLATGIILRSDNAETMIGSRVEHVDKFVARVHDEDREKVLWSRNPDGSVQRAPVQFRYHHPDGRLLWLQSSALQIGEDASEGVIAGITIDITAEKQAEADLIRAATRDSLTGLLNRTAFRSRFDESLARTAATGGGLTLFLVDIDGLKLVNDRLGHDAGDHALRLAAEIIGAAGPEPAFAARLGGDEFALVREDCPTPEAALAVAEELHAALSRRVSFRGHTLRLGASVGLALYPAHGAGAADLLKSADLALYAGKAAGRGRVCLFTPLLKQTFDARSALLAEIELALQAGAIGPWYQPKVDLATGSIVGFEALARWQHPGRGTLTPATFGAAFEDARLAVDIGHVMRAGVLADLRRWTEAGLPVGRIALNLSSYDFMLPDVAGSLLRAVDEAGVPVHHIEVEVTETVLLDRSADAVEEALTALHRAGVKIALDDFGTGYASLVHLKRYPVDEIKLDRSFVGDLAAGSDAVIVQAIIGLGRSLGLSVVAEGVETPDQARALRSMGCAYGQGYLFGRPMPAAAVPALFGSGRRPAA